MQHDIRKPSLSKVRHSKVKTVRKQFNKEQFSEAMPIETLVKNARAIIKKGRCAIVYNPQRHVAYSLGIRDLFGQWEIILRSRSRQRSVAILQAWVSDVASGMLLSWGTLGMFGYSLREADEKLVDCAPAMKILYGEHAAAMELFWSDTGYWSGKEGRRKSEREIREWVGEREAGL